MSAPALPKVRGPLFCGAQKTDGSGASCRRPSGWGTDHAGWGRCRTHGGNTPSHRAASQMQQAAATAQLFGVPREVDPLTGMLETYHQTLGILDAVEAMCMQLLPAEVVWGLTKEKKTAAGDGGDETLSPAEQEYGPGINTWVQLLERWHDRAFKEAEAMLKLDLESRRLSVDASHIAAMVAVLMSAELGLSEDQRRVAARLLRGMDQRPAIEAT